MTSTLSQFLRFQFLLPHYVPCVPRKTVWLIGFWLLHHPWGFSWGCCCPISPLKPQRVLARCWCVSSPFKFLRHSRVSSPFKLLELLLCLYSWNQRHFPSKYSSQFGTATIMKNSWQQMFVGWGSTILQVHSSRRNGSLGPFLSPAPTYRWFGITPVIPLSTFSFSCLFWVKPLMWSPIVSL